MADNAAANLTPAQVQKLAAELAAKRSELVQRIAELEHEIVVKDDCSLADAADASSLQESRLRARGMVEQHQSLIKEIDAALQRIENGKYGISESTGDPISYDRLKLIPWARTSAKE